MYSPLVEKQNCVPRRDYNLISKLCRAQLKDWFSLLKELHPPFFKKTHAGLVFISLTTFLKAAWRYRELVAITICNILLCLSINKLTFLWISRYWSNMCNASLHLYNNNPPTRDIHLSFRYGEKSVKDSYLDLSGGKTV